MNAPRRGFTLMETLAAAALLGMVAAAAVPLLRSLVASGRAQDRVVASAWLSARIRQPLAGGDLPVSGHPTWRMRVERLANDPATPPAGPPRVAWRVVIGDGEAILAETVAVQPIVSTPDGQSAP